MGKLAPSFADVVTKYVTDTGEDRKSVEDQIRAHAKSMGTGNLDVAAFLWVKEIKNQQPPAMRISAIPFALLEKPYLPLNEVDIKTLGEETGFSIRGYVLSKRGAIVKSSGKPMAAVMITDGTDVREILYFGEQVEKVNNLIRFPEDRGVAVVIKNVQCKWNKQDPTKWGVSVSGYFSETAKIGERDLDLPGKAAIAGMNPTKTVKQLKQREVAVLRVRAISADNKPYVGCPRCKKKITDNIPAGRMALCPNEKTECGTITAINVDRPRLKAFDDSDECVLSFGFGSDSIVPMTKLDEFAHTKATLMAAGQLNDSGEFDTAFLLPVTPTAFVETVTTATPVPTNPTTTNPTVMVQTVSTPSTLAGTLKTVTKTIDQVALQALKVFGPRTKDSFINEFLVAKKGVGKSDAENLIIDLLEKGSIVLDGDTLRIA